MLCILRSPKIFTLLRGVDSAWNLLRLLNAGDLSRWALRSHMEVGLFGKSEPRPRRGSLSYESVLRECHLLIHQCDGVYQEAALHKKFPPRSRVSVQ